MTDPTARPAAAVSSPPPDQTAVERVAEVLRPHASLGGTPPRYELPFFDGATPSLPRISGWKPLDDVAAALAAVLPPTVDRAAEFELRGTAEIRAAALLEAADFVRGLLLTRTLVTTTSLEAELRRLAAEAQPAPPERNFAAYQAAIARVALVLREARKHREQTDPSERQDCVMCGADHFAEIRDAIKGKQPDTETPASTAPLAAGLPHVAGRCPACGYGGLFLGSGGYVTCSQRDCPEPDAASTVLERRAAAKETSDAPAVPVQPAAADTERIVAYVLTARTDLHCIGCTPSPRGDIWTPVTADELEDGGVCVRCGVDVLIPQEPQS